MLTFSKKFFRKKKHFKTKNSFKCPGHLFSLFWVFWHPEPTLKLVACSSLKKTRLRNTDSTLSCQLKRITAFELFTEHLFKAKAVAKSEGQCYKKERYKREALKIVPCCRFWKFFFWCRILQAVIWYRNIIHIPPGMGGGRQQPHSVCTYVLVNNK